MNDDSMLTNYENVISLVAALVAKLGGRVELTQDELDGMVGRSLMEEGDGVRGVLTLSLGSPSTGANSHKH